MNRKDDHATKEDIAILEGDITGLKGDITRLDAKVDKKFGTLDAKIDDRFGALDAKIDSGDTRLDAKIDRVAMELVRTQGQMEQMEERLSAKIESNSSRVLSAVDKLTAVAKHYEQADATRGQALIGALESARTRPAR